MSDYVKIMELRKMALRKGDQETAIKLHKKARALRDSGKVSDDEMMAAAYI